MTPAPPPDSENSNVTIETLARWWKVIVAIVGATFIATGAYASMNGRISSLEGERTIRARNDERLVRLERNVAFLVCQADQTKCREAMSGIGE